MGLEVTRMMNVLQSTIEKGLYVLLLVMFLVNIAILYEVGKVINNHTDQLQQQNQLAKDIEKNQFTNSSAIKDYIACLININPAGNVQQQEQTCFDRAPNIK
jgi:hypothetical protein